MAGRSASMAHAFHPHLQFMAEPGRTLLCIDHRQGHTSRLFRFGQATYYYGHLRSASRPMPNSYKPTTEQHAVVGAVLGGGDLKIKAYAGAGKTSTLRLIS